MNHIAHACSFYDRDAPIYTMSRFLPPSKVQDAEVRNSILGDGSVIRAGCRINHSVIGLRTLISEGCTIDDALIMGSDYYETIDECALVPGCLPMGLGKPAIPSWLSAYHAQWCEVSGMCVHPSLRRPAQQACMLRACHGLSTPRGR